MPSSATLADYAAALCRSATHHTPDNPSPTAQELLASVAMIVSLSVPRPDRDGVIAASKAARPVV